MFLCGCTAHDIVLAQTFMQAKMVNFLPVDIRAFSFLCDLSNNQPYSGGTNGTAIIFITLELLEKTPNGIKKIALLN